MDVPCSIQGNIHAFSLIINVSRILGTYQPGGSFPLINSISINQHIQFLNGLGMRKLTQ